MATYDFSTLSPHDFELLSRDLLSRYLGVQLESFKSGRDKGVDLRYSRDKHNSVIVQCKHYAGSRYANLKSKLKLEEVPKLPKLAPSRYILVTSLPLNPSQKDDLADLLSPHVTTPTDILGCDDLNNLLRDYPDLERMHFKLWITSLPVIQAVLHARVFSRSCLDEQDIRRRLSLFVPTGAVGRALKMLNDHGYCLISGIPGIGKTTTAQMLIAMLVKEGWECLSISSNVEDALSVFNRELRQVFYYDDFLGQTSLDEKLLKNEDHDLLRLIKACSERRDTKRLVLTTREYLLVQARQQHEVLYRSGIDLSKCTVELADYTKPIRAQILVNHLYFYGVSEDARAKLIKDGDARRIVDHPNYSPRIVEWMCESASLGRLDPDEFAVTFRESLDNPQHIWQHAFERQLSEDARQLLHCLSTLGDNTDSIHLDNAFQAIDHADRDPITLAAKYKSALEELEGNFVRIAADGKRSVISFHNPSVKDFTDRLVLSNPAMTDYIVRHAIYHEQVVYSAQLAAKTHHELDQTELLRAIDRTLEAEPTNIIFDDARKKFVLVHEAISTRLSFWMDHRTVGTPDSFTESIGSRVVDYLNDPVTECETVSRVLALRGKIVANADGRKTALPLSEDALQKWMIDYLANGEYLKAPWDFGAALEFLNTRRDSIGEREYSQDLKTLRESFVGYAATEIQRLYDESESSDGIDSVMNDLLDVAAELNVEDELDTDAIKERRNQFAEYEEMQAERYEEDWKDHHLERMEDERGVDDILDSLS